MVLMAGVVEAVVAVAGHLKTIPLAAAVAAHLACPASAAAAAAAVRRAFPASVVEVGAARLCWMP